MSLPQRIKIAEQLVRRIEWQDLNLAALRRFVEAARAEAGFPEATKPTGATAHRTAELAAQGELVACGVELVAIVASVFQLKTGSRAWVADGAPVSAGDVIATLSGPENALRPAAAIACAAIRRLSGIAGFARRHSAALGDGRTRLLDSGEFTPGWRMLEKYALARGGAWDGGNESARVLIDSAGRSPSELDLIIRSAREANPETPIEVVVRDREVVAAAADAQADLIRLERFEARAVRDAVSLVNGRAFVEAHGGIDLLNIAAHAGLGLDFVSADGLVSRSSWAPVGVSWRD